ncbi:biotin/lipoyl-binding protein, partial [Candidatus Nomurabacteria bacterium]|nr:biotin/lipoyl-binding protein [Candidatus Nomurabacteria bacterium]
MKEKAKSFFKTNIRRKRTWGILIIVLLIASYFIFKTPSSAQNTVTDIAKLSDLKQTVLATGQVVASTDLNLSFKGTGVVKSLKVKVGDKVKAGQILAMLDGGSEYAALTSARGALAGAEARLKRTIEGASNEEIALAEVNYNQTKLTQGTLVNSAYQNLLNSKPEAVPKDGTSDYTAPVISGTYTLGKEGVINLKSYYSVGGTSYVVSGLTNGSGASNTISAQPLGDSGLY